MNSATSFYGARPVEPPVPKGAIQRIRAADHETEAGHDVAVDVMEEVVGQAMDLMISKHFDRVSIPYTVRSVTKEMLDFIKYAFVGQDCGGIQQAQWTADKQADPVEIDTWARGAVTKHVKPASLSTTNLSSLSVGASAPSRRGEKTISTNSIAPHHPDRRRSRAEGLEGASKRLSVDSVKRKTQSKSPSITPRGSTLPAEDDKPATDTHKGQELTGPQATEEAEYIAHVKAEKQRRLESKQLADRLSKQMEEHKKEPFVVDAISGKVIATKPVEQPSAKQKDLGVKYGIVGTADESPERDAPKAKKPAPKPKGVGPKKAKKSEGSEFLKEDVKTGPMVEGVMPSGGVQCREGDATKRSDMKIPKSKVTRAEFLKMMEFTNAQANVDEVPPAAEKKAERRESLSKDDQQREKPAPTQAEIKPRDTFVKPQKVAVLPSQPIAPNDRAHGSRRVAPEVVNVSPVRRVKKSAQALAATMEHSGGKDHVGEGAGEGSDAFVQETMRVHANASELFGDDME